MKKLIFKYPLYSFVTVITLTLLFGFSLYYFSHDTDVVQDRSAADSLMLVDEE